MLLHHCPHLLASKVFCIGGNTVHLAFTSYLPCKHLSVQSSVINGYQNVFILISSGTNLTPNVQSVSVVCMQENLGKPTYPPNLKIMPIINKNGLLVFGIYIDYCGRSSLKERKAWNFRFKYLSEHGQPTPIFQTLKSPWICIDLRVPDQGLGRGQAAPLVPPPLGICPDFIQDNFTCSYHGLNWQLIPGKPFPGAL